MEMGLSFSIFGKKTCVMGGQAAAPCESYFAQCADKGIRYVEVLIMAGYLEPGDWAAIEQVGRWAEAHSVVVRSVHGPSGWPTNGHWLGDPDEASRQRNVQERCLAIEGARRLGARYMIVEFEVYDQWPYWPHLQEAQHTFPDSLAQWRRSFEELLEVAERAGVALAVENVDGTPTEELAALMTGLGREQAGVCFDSSHATYGGDLFGELALLAPYVIGTHLSDNDGLAGGAWTDRHWRPFEGIIDWPRLVQKIVEQSPCDCLTLEVLDRENPQVSDELVGSCRRLQALLPA